MGFFFNFTEPQMPKVEAALAPFNIPDFTDFPFLSNAVNSTATRLEAMTVPSVARGRNIICGTIASIPLDMRSRDMSRVPLSRFIEQPDPRVPASVVYAYTAEDLLFRGNAYWQIMAIDETTQRPAQAQWVSASLVIEELDATGKIIVGYSYDGQKLPNQGVGSLIAFTGLDEGFLNRAGRTIKTAAALEKAVLNYAKEPMPSIVLKSGNPLSKERIKALLDTWRTARQERSTAFINDQIDITTLGFTSSELQMNEARQYLATEIARALGIPDWYLNAAAGGSMTYSNVSDERKTLIDFSLRPIMTAIEQRLSMDDITLRGMKVRFNLDDLLRGNAIDRASIYNQLIPLGVLTVEEARQMEDMVTE
jgi:HK97 family phage portal protein